MKQLSKIREKYCVNQDKPVVNHDVIKVDSKRKTAVVKPQKSLNKNSDSPNLKLPKTESPVINGASQEKSTRKKERVVVVEEQIVELEDDEIPEEVITTSKAQAQENSVDIASVHKEETKALSGKLIPQGSQEDESWRKMCYRDGVWHKWVLERLDDEQKEKYYKVKGQLEKENIYFSENKIIRFLAAKEFDDEEAYDMLIANHNFYKENDVEVLNESEFQTLINNECMVIHKADKYGRPVVYMRLRKNQPSRTTDRQLMQYMLWIMRRIKDAMPKYVDSYVLIYDLKGSGWSNFSVNQMSGAAKSTGSQFPETLYKIIILNSNW